MYIHSNGVFLSFFRVTEGNPTHDDKIAGYIFYPRSYMYIIDLPTTLVSIAHWVETLTGNQRVMGSIPSVGSVTFCLNSKFSFYASWS